MELINEFGEIASFLEIIRSEGMLYVLLTLVVLFVAGKIHAFKVVYDLQDELTTKDNKAVALTYTGYLLGVAIILEGVLTGDSQVERSMAQDTLATLGWGALGVALLGVARWVNDKLLLRGFCNIKELVDDRNVGTGAVEFGSYVGSAFMIAAALYGESLGLVADLSLVLVYFVLGQVGFILFGQVYARVLRYDLKDEIEKDNVAAGIGFGFALIAIGLMLSGFMKHSDSFVGYALWLPVAGVILLASRYFLDKCLIPGDLVDEEISRDRNWGAALVEGVMVVAIAILVNAVMFQA